MANTFGLYNPNSTLNDQVIKNYRSVFFNLNEDELFEAAIQRSEGVEVLEVGSNKGVKIDD